MERLDLGLFPSKNQVVDAIHEEEEPIRRHIVVDMDGERAWVNIEWKLREFLKDSHRRLALKFEDSDKFIGKTKEKDGIKYTIPGTLKLLALGDARAHTRQVPMQTILGIAIENLQFLSASVRWFMTIVIFDALDHYEYLQK
jgi:hypothetical protein